MSRFGQHQAQGDRLRVATGVLNYERVLPRCQVAVHHGGSGTVAASVAARIPTFVCSLVADNPFWGALSKNLALVCTSGSPTSITTGWRPAYAAHCTKRSSPDPELSGTRCGRTLGPQVVRPTSSRASCLTDPVTGRVADNRFAPAAVEAAPPPSRALLNGCSATNPTCVARFWARWSRENFTASDEGQIGNLKLQRSSVQQKSCCEFGRWVTARMDSGSTDERKPSWWLSRARPSLADQSNPM